MRQRKHQLSWQSTTLVDTQDKVSNARTKRRRIVARSINIILGLLFAVLAITSLGHPRPQPPFVQVCPHDDIDVRHGECRSVVLLFGQAPGFADLGLLVNYGLPFDSTTLQFRVYKSDASGDRLYGTAVVDDLDPTWTAWSLQSLWENLTLAEGTGSAHTPPEPGQYRIEVLNHAGRYLTETRLKLPWSPNDRQTATPVHQTGS